MNAALKFRVAGKTPTGRDRLQLAMHPLGTDEGNKAFSGGAVAGSFTMEVSQATADQFDIGEDVAVTIEVTDKERMTPVADSSTAPAPLRGRPEEPADMQRRPTPTPASFASRAQPADATEAAAVNKQA